MEIICERITKTSIHMLIDYCSRCPDLYNRIANIMNDDFNLRSAEINLLITYMISQYGDLKDAKEKI